jgi:hypothetical protein
MTRLRASLLASLALIPLAGAANAATLVGLSGDDTLVTFDSDARRVTATARVQGAALHGIDVRPADGRLYGLTRDGRIVVIDAATGAVTERSRLDQPIAADGRYVVDFNPMADRLRVIGMDGTSLRINVDTGATAVDGRLRYATSDANAAVTPRVVAGAYINSVAGTTATTLYDIDAAARAYVRQAPPNDGILNTLGAVAAPLDGPVAFDIVTEAGGANTGYLVTGTMLHVLNVANGETRALGSVAGLPAAGLKDVAVVRP